MEAVVPLKDASELCKDERLFYRDKLREARYEALADAESFQQICFAIEALGKRLEPEKVGLGNFRECLRRLVVEDAIGADTSNASRDSKSFDVLFTALREARNVAMHTVAYARHVTTDAVTLSLMFESALMNEQMESNTTKRLTVGDFMVSTPVTVQPWQSVAQARQALLINSFTFLPMWHEDKWHLISDAAIASYLRPNWPAKSQLNRTLSEAVKDGLKIVQANPVNVSTNVNDLLNDNASPTLWLVTQKDYPPGHLVGVLSPFELM